MPLSQSQMVQGRYRIMYMLGKGGFGAVYLAEDTRLPGRRVALKENLDPSREAQAQFHLEANTLAALKHAHLPSVSDHFIEPSGKQYLVMDFVAGEDVDQILKRQGWLPEGQVLRWFDQIADALDYLHRQQRPIIHRDIKPANIRITPEGGALLVDFGIAKAYQQGQSTMNAARAVTTGFSPPEQYGLGRTDARSDVYALGATLYCMVTGEVPPDAMDRLQGTGLMSPRHFNSALSLSTERAILHALELDPAKRPQSVQALRQAISRTRQEPRPPPNRPGPRRSSRHVHPHPPRFPQRTAAARCTRTRARSSSASSGFVPF